MKKLCIIYNFPQKYREAIFQLIDKEWRCDWYFGNNTTDIRGFDLSILNSHIEVKNIILKGSLTYQKGVPSLLFKKDYDKYLMLGDFNCLSTWLMLLIKKILVPNKRIYLWTHGWYGRENRIKKFLKRIFFGSADGIFLYGNYARELMIENGYNPKKLFVIHNSLDYENQYRLRKKITLTDSLREHFANSHPNIIFIGRLTKVKRIDLLVEALDILNREGFKVNLTLIGNGSEMMTLQELVKAKKLDKQVWFYGACYDDTKNSELIYHADLCVAPGNVGLTAMHTMAFGTPVLTHDNFPMQMPEFEAITPGESGDFFKYDDVGSLAHMIKEWLESHSNDRDRIREKCIDIIEGSWNPQYQINIFKQHIK